MPRSSIVAVAAVLLCALSAANTAESNAAAASPYGTRGELSLENPYRPPSVFVPNLVITNQHDDGTITGEFTVWNKSEAIVGDLTYRIDLLSPLPEGATEEVIEDRPLLYDRFVAKEIPLALAPNEERTLPFQYTAPAVPAGTYRLQLLMTTSQGRDMGWKDVPVTYTGTSRPFADIFASSLSLPEFPDQVLGATSGPNVSPATSFTIRAAAKARDRSHTVQSVLTIYPFDVARGMVTTIEGAPLALTAAEAKEITLNVTAAQEPGIYYALLELQDQATQRRVSSLGEYRWVVRGPDADVLTTLVPRIATVAGEKMRVQVDYAGAADAETVQTGTLDITLRDSAGELAALTVPQVQLSDAIGGGEADLRLSRDLVPPFSIHTVVSDAQGEVLDTYEVAFPLTREALEAAKADQQSRVPYKELGLVAVVVGLVLGGIGLYQRWRPRARRKK